MLCEGSNPNNKKKILRQLKAAHGKQYNVKKIHRNIVKQKPIKVQRGMCMMRYLKKKIATHTLYA